MKLTKIQQLHGTLELLSGLHIGAGDSEIHIGGTDNPVIKHPLTNHPYIPGSSLKGKVRSLLEWRSGAVQSAPLSFNNLKDASDNHKADIKSILQLFGISGGDNLTTEQAMELGPTRLSFWDINLQSDWVKAVEEKFELLTESKSENTIDRISGTAKHPRNTERIPAGARFDFKLSIKKLDTDTDELLSMVLLGLKLLEQDSLGGSGSRGYGKVRFIDLHLNDENIQNQFSQVNPF